MLVLTRKVGTVVSIGDDIEVTLLSVNAKGEARLGFAAPREVEIWRKELDRQEPTDEVKAD